MARSIGEIIPGILIRSQRLSILRELVATYGNQEDRKDMVMALYDGDIISAESAELLIENLGLEAA